MEAPETNGRRIQRWTRPFSTLDVQLAAAICAAGLPLPKVIAETPRRCAFEFAEAGRAGELAAAYGTSSLPVDARTVFARLSDLRDEMHRVLAEAQGVTR